MSACPSCGTENVAEAKFCSECGASLIGAVPSREVRKTVTVVFCDVSGSTALGERIDPESLRGVMTRYFERMRSVLESHGGTVEKFIGDAVMAVFGVPQAHEDDALRAVRAAAEMRPALAVLNEYLEREHGSIIASGSGVNTGEVIAGDPSRRSQRRDGRRGQHGRAAGAGAERRATSCSATTPTRSSATRSSSGTRGSARR